MLIGDSICSSVTINCIPGNPISGFCCYFFSFESAQQRTGHAYIYFEWMSHITVDPSKISPQLLYKEPAMKLQQSRRQQASPSVSPSSSTITMYEAANARGPTPLYTPQATGTKFDPRVFPSAQPYPIIQVNRRPVCLRFLCAFAVSAMVWFLGSTFLRTWLPSIYRPLVS